MNRGEVEVKGDVMNEKGRGKAVLKLRREQVWWIRWHKPQRPDAGGGGEGALTASCL